MTNMRERIQSLGQHQCWCTEYWQWYYNNIFIIKRHSPNMRRFSSVNDSKPSKLSKNDVPLTRHELVKTSVLTWPNSFLWCYKSRWRLGDCATPSYLSPVSWSDFYWTKEGQVIPLHPSSQAMWLRTILIPTRTHLFRRPPRRFRIGREEKKVKSQNLTLITSWK